MRDRVEAAQAETRRVGTEHIERGPHGPHHEMSLPRGGSLAAFPGHLYVQPAVRHPGHGHVVQGQREGQGVEPRAEVGAAGRRPDHDGLVPPPGSAQCSPGVRADGQQNPTSHSPRPTA